jgi:type VI secretion system secreted protein VgrG
VVGPDGEEIHTDEYGRVKVRFHWDHRAEANAGNTIWLRVMQPWSGKNWGMQTIPRVGSEVAVAFVDADLDHPIVIGSLYNGEQMHPLSPADKVKTGIRTRSYPGGGTEDYNEISMDDTAGAEVFLVHAQYDHVVEVEHDQTITVGNDRKLTVKVDETVKVEGNQTVTVSKKRSVEVSQDDDLLNVKMGKLATTVDMGDVTTTAKLGNITVEASVGAIKLSALQSIELVCGPTTSVKLTPQGVEIKGMMITVDGAMKTEVKGLMTDVSGTAMLKLGGGITMIG